MKKKVTSIQKQFLLLHKLLEKDLAYNIVSCMRITGFVDETRLHRAWVEVFSHIPLFSSKYEDIENISFLSEAELPAAPWEYISVDSEEEALTLIQSYADTPFQLEIEIPVKTLFIHVNGQLNFFLILKHHLVVDLHSKEILSRALSSAYNTGSTDLSLNEYAENFNSEEQLRQDVFWRKYLEKPPKSLLLPSSTPFRSGFDGSGDTVFRTMSSELTHKIRQQEEKNTLQPFLILLSAYAVVLSRLSGSKDFFIGVPFSNRRESSRNKMFGPFVNILPLRVNIEEGDTLLSLYQKIRRTMLLLHRNQEMPFLDFSCYSNVPRDPKVPGFLQVGFTREEPFSLSLDGLECTPVPVRPHGAQMDLFFTYWEEEEVLKYRWEYNSNAFHREQIRSWQDSFEYIVDQLMANLNKALVEIDCISPGERNILKNFYKKNERCYPLSTSIRSHLIYSYENYQENTAIKDCDRSLSYSEFSSHAKKYAAHFNSLCGAGGRIAVLMKNSIERTELIHAVVCSGNSYLPLDPNWPRLRIEFILKDAGVNCVVTTSSFRTHIPEGFPVILTEDLLALEGEAEFSETYENDEFAVLYTSGSTGEPKGVQITGRGIANRLFWMQDYVPLSKSDTLVHKVPYTFDVSIWEIFWPFLNGASLFIPDPEKHLDDENLAGMIQEHNISYIHFVPSLLSKFLNMGNMTNFPRLKGVICSGEPLEVPLIKNYFKSFQDVPLYNFYGPTEASIDVTAWRCSAGDLEREQLPIGYPIANTRIYILDENKRLCPPYVRGEITIAGVCLADGYVNNDLTGKNFIHGNWGWGEETVYLSGDTGYYHDDCVIEYVGRKDNQIKINGNRIELSEIEKRLESLPYVHSAVVLVTGREYLCTELSAFLITGEKILTAQIKKDLSEFLPGYMIPKSYITLDAYPLLENGKIDRRKLLEIQPSEEKSVTKIVKLEVEDVTERVIQIWKTLLDIEALDTRTNFFDIGGHSQLLPQLKAGIDEISERSIELMDLLKRTTVEEQVNLIVGRGEKQEETPGVSQRERMAKIAERKRGTRPGR